jgi:hypothetical protein
MVAIDNWLECEAGARLSPQLHLDRASSESAYWHLGYSQAMADVLRAISLRSFPENIEDNATSC